MNRDCSLALGLVVLLFVSWAGVLSPDLASGCEPEVYEVAPIAASCTIHVTIYGHCLGVEHRSDNGVMLLPKPPPSPFNPLPYPEGDGIVVPIHAWTNEFIEFAVPCLDSNLAPGDYYVVVFWYDGGVIQFADNTPVFTIMDHPTVLTVTPASGGCMTVLTVSGSGGFGPIRDAKPSIFDPVNNYYGRLTVVDFVAEFGTYTATQFRNWSDTSFEVLFGYFFEDQVDTCGTNPVFYDLDLRNFVQDDGTPVASGPCAGHVCPAESTILDCSILPCGTYNMYVKNIYYGDEDGSDSLSCGDTMFQIEKSDSAQWGIGADPYLNKVAARHIACSYLDRTGGTGIHWSVLRIYGGNFGSEQGNGSVVVGPYSWWTSDPLGSYFEQPFLMWSSTLIKVGFVLPEAWEKYFPPAAAQGRLGVLWVRKDGWYTDPLPLYVDYCDIIR